MNLGRFVIFVCLGFHVDFNYITKFEIKSEA